MAKKPKIPSRRQVRKNYEDIMSQINDHYIDPDLDEEGGWLHTHGQSYLYLRASDYYALGLLEGKWLKPKIKNLRRIIRAVANIYRTKGYSYKRFLEMGRIYEESIHDSFLFSGDQGNYIDEIQGIADAIPGVSFEDIFVQNCFIDIVYGHLNPKFKKYPKEYEFGCTSIGVVNPNLPNHIIAGQNFDFNITFKPTLAFVSHKVGSNPWIFSLRMGGGLSLPAGINEYKVSAFINIIKSNVLAKYTTPSGIRTRNAFCESKTADDYYNLVELHDKPAGYNMLIADPNKLISVQAHPLQHIRTDISEWWVSSNTYTHPSFQKYLLEPDYSKQRQIYTETRVEKGYFLGFDESSLMNVLADDPIISRNKKNPFESRTLAFITRNHFGLGNPTDDSHGKLPEYYLLH